MTPEVVVDPKRVKLLNELIAECPRYEPDQTVPNTHLNAHASGALVHGYTAQSPKKVVCITQLSTPFVSSLQLSDKQKEWNKIREIPLGDPLP